MSGGKKKKKQIHSPGRKDAHIREGPLKFPGKLTKGPGSCCSHAVASEQGDRIVTSCSGTFWLNRALCIYRLQNLRKLSEAQRVYVWLAGSASVISPGHRYRSSGSHQDPAELNQTALSSYPFTRPYKVQLAGFQYAQESGNLTSGDGNDFSGTKINHHIQSDSGYLATLVLLAVTTGDCTQHLRAAHHIQYTVNKSLLLNCVHTALDTWRRRCCASPSGGGRLWREKLKTTQNNSKQPMGFTQVIYLVIKKNPTHRRQQTFHFQTFWRSES